MLKVAVLGAGLVGKAIAIDLAKTLAVTSIDFNETSFEGLKQPENNIQLLKQDLQEYEHYPDFLKKFDFVISAVPGFMGYRTLQAIIKAGKSVVDISFFPENALELGALAKENNVTAIVDCGVAPGMSNLILGYYNERMQVDCFDCMVGGLPKIRTQPFEYKAPFSPADVIQEYIRPARFIQNGQLISKPALSDAEFIEFKNIGTLEAFNTDGLRSLLLTMPHIPNMKERTLRYPGHIDLMKALIRGGFFDKQTIEFKGQQISPIEFSSAILFNQWKIDPEEEEFTVMRIEISGSENGRETKVNCELFDEYDPITKTSSMARTTGYTATAALHLLIEGSFNQKGVFPPELIGKDENCFNYIINYLAKRNVIYSKTKHTDK